MNPKPETEKNHCRSLGSVSMALKKKSFRLLRKIILLPFIVIQVVPSKAQEFDFRLITSSDLIAATASPSALEFGALTAGSEDRKTIRLHDAGAVIITITAPEESEITIQTDFPSRLEHERNPASTLPVNLRFSYSNNGSPDPLTAKNSAHEVPENLNAVTFPTVVGPENTLLADYSPARASLSQTTCYLFFYGSLGPANQKQLVAGNYTATVTVLIEETP